MRLRLLVLAVLALLFAFASSRVSFTTDTADILPTGSALRETLAAAQKFPGAQMLVVEVDGTRADREALKAAVADLGARLEALEAIGTVRAGFSTDDGVAIRQQMAPYATAFLDAATLADLTREPRIAEQVEAQRKRLAGFGGAFMAGMIREDPLDVRGRALDVLRQSARPGAHLEDGLLLDDSGTRALILASTTVEASQIRPRDARVHAIEAAIEATPLPTRWFGGTRMGYETATAIERDVRVTAGLGMVLLGIVLFAGFRSWRPIAGAVLPSAVAAGCATVGAWWASPVHGLQLGFSAALAGLAVDYWVHLYLAAAARPGQTDRASRYRAALDALRDLAPALAVSAGSTALAFALLTTSALPIVRVLGITGAAAALGAWLGVLVAGPVSWALFGRPEAAVERHAPASWAAPVAWSIAVLTVLGTASRFEPDPMALLATSPAAEADEHALAERFGLTDLRGLVLVEGPEAGEVLDRALAVQEALDGASELASTGPARLLPGPATVAARRAALPPVEVLQDRLDRAAEAAGLPPFEGAAARIHAWAAVPPVDLWDGTPLQDRVTLRGTQALVTVPVREDTDLDALAAVVAQADPQSELVVPGALATRSMDRARSALISRAALGGLAVLALLAVRHRSLSRAALALAPAAASIAGALGAMTLSGAPWNPVSLAAMVPVLGLAVDYGVFMTERATRSAPRAVSLSAITTLAGFATLALARSPALFGVGVATFAGVGMAALTALIVLPAVQDHGWPRGPLPETPDTPGHYDRQRWPGWDGWLVAVLGLLAGLAALLRPEALGPAAWIVALSAPAMLVLTAGVRTPTRSPTPPVDGTRILTVVPTKDNAGSIEAVVRGCLAHTADVLMVDDGCTDGSGELAAAAGAIVVRHPVNRGKGAALETALDWAAQHGFSHIVAIDADGQHEPDDLPSFFEAVRRDPRALVAGVRDMSAAPKGARYARANSNFWVWVETSRRMGDTQCGYRAYPVGPIRALKLVPSRYQWEMEVLVRSVWAGIPVIDHPCRVFYPPKEERVSSYRKVVDTARITWLNVHLIAERVLWPPRWMPPR